ncbi:hypothetical protein EYR38_009718 [Pleurotus pulmonarius]|nr:hypothetical protein EYR38_010388 [Pleurotus pulmonarius]KAF4590418.1 hypothetical protein EYR38_009718 [Pleurotus pulmonarius]
MFSRSVIPKHRNSDGVSGSDGENRGRLSRLKKFVLWLLGGDVGGKTGESEDTASPTLRESSVDRNDTKQSENDWRSADDISILEFGSALPGGRGEDTEMRMMGRRFENEGMYVNGVGGSMSAGYDDWTFATHQAQDPKVGSMSPTYGDEMNLGVYHHVRDEHQHQHDCWNGGSLGSRSDRERYPYGRGRDWQTMNRRTSTAFGYPSPVLDPTQLIKNNQATYPPGSFLNQSFPGRSALYDYAPLSEPPHKQDIDQTALYGHMDMRMQPRAATEDPRVTGAMLRGTERR